MGPRAGPGSWTATSSPPTVTLTCPDGVATTVALRPMHDLGTENWRPAALTSMVGGTTWVVTSPTISCSSLRLPTGLRCSFSRMNSAAGGTPVVPLGSALQRASMRATASLRPSSPTKSRS